MQGKIELVVHYASDIVTVINKKNQRSAQSLGSKVVNLRRNPKDDIELTSNHDALLEVGVIEHGYVQPTLPFE